MRKSILFAVFLVIFSVSVHSQDEVCISQEAANACRDNTLMKAALTAKVSALEAVVMEKDRLFGDLQAVTRQNEADLRAEIVLLQVDLATKVGELIDKEKDLARMTLMLDFMLKNGRKKCGTFTLICIQ